MFRNNKRNHRQSVPKIHIDSTHLCHSQKPKDFIPLPTDIPMILGRLSTLSGMMIQLINDKSDMAVVLSGEEIGQSINSTNDILFLGMPECPEIAFVHASLATCSCCGSPGSIDFFNTDCVCVMKIFLMPDICPNELIDIISELANNPSCKLLANDLSTSIQTSYNLPNNAHTFDMLPCGFLKLLIDYGNLGQALEYTFYNQQLRLKRKLLIQQIQDLGSITQCIGNDGGFSIHSKSIMHFVRHKSEDDECEYLSLMGADELKIIDVSLPNSATYGFTWPLALDRIEEQYSTK
jgi:hypothetical protein